MENKERIKIMSDKELISRESTEALKYNSMNLTPSKIVSNELTNNENESIKSKKMKRVSFIDQIQSNKEIAEIIYINRKDSLKEDKKNDNNNVIVKSNDKEEKSYNYSNNNSNSNNIYTYRIKRPKKSSLFAKKKVERVDERCGCLIF